MDIATTGMDQMSTGMSIAYIIACIIVYALLIVANWKLFTKAGEAGWKSLIPLYNLYIMCKIVDGKGIKFLLFCIPVVNFIYMILFSIRMAKAYGKSTGFAIGLIFLPNIFQLILAFGSAQYVGPQGK